MQNRRYRRDRIPLKPCYKIAQQKTSSPLDADAQSESTRLLGEQHGSNGNSEHTDKRSPTVEENGNLEFRKSEAYCEPNAVTAAPHPNVNSCYESSCYESIEAADGGYGLVAPLATIDTMHDLQVECTTQDTALTCRL